MSFSFFVYVKSSTLFAKDVSALLHIQKNVQLLYLRFKKNRNFKIILTFISWKPRFTKIDFCHSAPVYPYTVNPEKPGFARFSSAHVPP